MRGVLFDVIPERDAVLVILDSGIAELHGCAEMVERAVEKGETDIGNVVIIDEIQKT